MLKVPQWLAARREDDGMDDDFTVPPVATLPPAVPEFSTHDEESMLVQRAAALHAQLKRSIETAHVELAESVLGRQGDQQKIGYLEKENAELRLVIAEKENTIATLQSEIGERRHFASMIQDINTKTALVLSRFGTHPLPKPERKPRPKKKADRESTTETAETVG